MVSTGLTLRLLWFNVLPMGPLGVVAEFWAIGIDHREPFPIILLLGTLIAVGMSCAGPMGFRYLCYTKPFARPSIPHQEPSGNCFFGNLPRELHGTPLNFFGLQFFAPPPNTDHQRDVYPFLYSDIYLVLTSWIHYLWKSSWKGKFGFVYTWCFHGTSLALAPPSHWGITTLPASSGGKSMTSKKTSYPKKVAMQV